MYQGGEYWLYRYKKYTDVRVVFAPEEQAAFFGGDPDNFTYPRFDLDVAVFRIYENGRPVRPEHFLRWNARGADEGELVFVSGHPGSTNRQDTVAELEFARDTQMPTILSFLEGRLAALGAYSRTGPEAARQADDLRFGLENSLKAYQGEYAGLLDRRVMGKKEAEERELRARIEANPEWKASALRLSYGTVQGYKMNGTVAPSKTTLFGLYDRSFSFGQKPPFNLPDRFLKRRSQLDLSTPVNFVSTVDITGGSSGSPVVNRNGDLVGLIFDGNIESLVGTYVYTEASNRAVAVHTAFISEALRRLYDAATLADELEKPAALPVRK